MCFRRGEERRGREENYIKKEHIHCFYYGEKKGILHGVTAREPVNILPEREGTSWCLRSGEEMVGFRFARTHDSLIIMLRHSFAPQMEERALGRAYSCPKVVIYILLQQGKDVHNLESSLHLNPMCL